MEVIFQIIGKCRDHGANFLDLRDIAEIMELIFQILGTLQSNFPDHRDIADIMELIFQIIGTLQRSWG